MTHLSWVALHVMAHSFTELDKAVVNVISVKKGKDMTLKDELPRSVGAQQATEKSREIIPERMKRWS